MNTKRAIWISLAFYIATLIIGIILTVIANISLSSPQEIPTTYWIITIVVTVLLTSLASIWYFHKKGVSRNIKEGFKLGLTFVIVGFILDSLFIIPALFTGSGADLLLEYYLTPSFYVILLLVIASATFIGSRSPSKTEIKTVKKKKK